MGNTILATITALSLGLACVVSTGSGAGCHSVDAGNGVCNYTGSVCSYIDEDGDGICDYAHGSCSYVDEDGDGICDYAHSACGYVDADGDGICDTCGRYHQGGPVWEETNSADTDREDSYNNSVNYSARPGAQRGHHGQGHGHGSRGRCGR